MTQVTARQVAEAHQARARADRAYIESKVPNHTEEYLRLEAAMQQARREYNEILAAWSAQRAQSN